MAQYWITVASIGYSLPTIDGFIQLFRLRNTKLSLKTVQPQPCLNFIPAPCIFERKDTPFVYLQLKNGFPFTCLLGNSTSLF